MPKTLTITIRCDNAAFEDNCALETGRILRHLANDIEDDDEEMSEGLIPLFDANGNRVGHANIESD